MATAQTPISAAEDLPGLTLQDARRVLLLCQTAETTTEAEIAYGAFLAECIETVLGGINWLRRPGNRFHDSDLGPWLKRARLFLSDLEAILVGHGPEDDVLAEGSLPRWRLTGDDVEGFVKRFDTLWYYLPDEPPPESVSGPRRIGRAPRAPAELFIDKLYLIQDRLFPPPKLGPWVDLDGVTRWLEHCDTHHTAHCVLSPQSEKLFPALPGRLIDVERMCLVSVTSRQRYAALSYVWGKEPSLMALRQNIDRLQHPGALDIRPWAQPAEGDAIAVQFPQTISHAIALTRQLGIPLLWVDALCIVQDDDSERQHQLDRMGSIYANAYVTLVAAGGTARSGLLGIRGHTIPMPRVLKTPRHLTHRSRKDGSLHKEIASAHHRVRDSVWSQRGWTFQEQIFSRRLLILDNTSVTWECHCAVWLEGMEAEEKECQNQGAVAAQGFAFSAEPNFGEYARHAAQFNRRQLTYPEDVLDAFAGILGVLSETAFREGFICGLPVRFFEAALLWYNKGELDKRRAKRQGSDESVIMPPSWAWAAWGGAVEYDSSPQEEGDKTPMRWRYGRPLVSWQYMAAGDKEWLPVTSSSGRQLSSSDVDGIAASTTAGEIRAHDTEGPVEDPSVGEPEAPAAAKSSHLLLAYPLSASFEVQQTFGKATVILSNGSGGSAGSLVSLGQPVSKGDLCELVAVSISSMNGEEAYDVLWIERDGGVAYRRGVGRIRKAPWQAMKTERIKLILG